MAFGSKLDEVDETISEINVTPFVDVILVLLILFMLTIPVVTQQIEIDLPQSKMTSQSKNAQKIEVIVLSNGFIQVQNKTMTKNEFNDWLKNQHTSSLAITLLGDKNVSYQTIVDVMSIIEQSGITQIELSTQTIS